MSTTKQPSSVACIRFVRWLWGFVSCWNCERFGLRRACLVERPTDGLHDQFMLCSKCAGMGIAKLQRELYPPNVAGLAPMPGQDVENTLNNQSK